MHLRTLFGAALLASCAWASSAQAENIYGLKPGHPELKSAAVLAFGPDGILFIGDAQAATVYAVDTGDPRAKPESQSYNVEGLQQKIAEKLGTQPGAVRINDIAVNPETGRLFLSVSTDSRSPRILSLDGSGQLQELDLTKIAYSQAALPNPPEDKEVGEGNRRRNNRGSSITDLAFVDGQLIVSGLSNDSAASHVWSLMFPFQKVDRGTAVEIYHGAHGRSEDYAPISTFIPFIVDGEPNVLAGYVCTPLVKFPLSKLSSSAAEQGKVQGTTVAELGNRNKPLDMIAYKKGGKDYLLLANSARGVMKISTEGIGQNPGITSPIKGGGTAGQEYETISNLQGVVQLDRLDDARAVVLIQEENGKMNLKTIDLP